MQVEFTQSVEVTGTASLSVDDITAMLAKRISECEERDRNGHRLHVAVSCFMAEVLECVNAVSMPMISEVRDSSRELIAKRLREEADRWSPK